MRGTFSQRHSGVVDQKTEDRYVPLNHICAEGQAALRGHQLACSREEAVLGFEYGYSAGRPQHPGDVGGPVRRLRERRPGGDRPVHRRPANEVARMCGLVHAAAARLRRSGAGAFLARLERFLQACAEDNMQVANCTTPANISTSCAARCTGRSASR